MISDQMEVAPKFSELAQVSERVERFAAAVSLSSSALFALQLCVEEALTNVIRHGDLSPEARMRLELRCEPGWLIAETSDPGRAFDPMKVPPPRVTEGLANAGIGGQGITLMRRFCPEIRYARVADANRLTFRFKLDRSE
jgi:anti-sigma regulatory factor (Ser/Thr protein kinase)